MTPPDFLIVGAGIYGITTALELHEQGHSVAILNPDQIPHPLAASTDVSKVVRMEYGSDVEYMAMVDEAIDGWHAWNDQFNDTLYHEVGVILAVRQPMDSGANTWEWESYQNLQKRGHKPERLYPEALADRYPVFDHHNYVDGFYNPRAGFAESGRVVATLTDHARQLGIAVHEGQTAEELVQEDGKVIAVKTREGETFAAGHVIICAGAHTPYLVSDLQPFMRVTGHPVFHINPGNPQAFTPPNFAVFTADVSKSGWYGFPLHPREKIIKIANHGPGLQLHPEHDERVVTDVDEARFRAFLAETFPSLRHDPIVYTRRCLYIDTLDGHFWIDQHPEIGNLTIGSGGSGHGFKMGPVLGRLIATAAEGGSQRWSERFRWRHLSEDTTLEEEARFVESD
ncbi:MAG: FAD-dependent oxidoreductase [Chloroflexi bacterium]|nr:FAD-dependent oxidoreductase [Chloroflexota bacterium]